MSARHATARIGSTYARYATQLVTGTHHSVADEPVDLGGGDTGPAPDEILLSALAACTAITLRMYAERKGLALTRVSVALSHEKVEVDGVMRDRINRSITLEGELSDEQRQRLLEIANKCPVHRALSQSILLDCALSTG